METKDKMRKKNKQIKKLKEKVDNLEIFIETWKDVLLTNMSEDFLNEQLNW